MPVIDAHVHFIDPARYRYPWLAGQTLEPIRRAFRPADLQPLLRTNGVDRVVLVQTLSSLEETRHFLDTAAQAGFVAGVVGWVDLTHPQVGEQLVALRAHPHGHLLVGIRHQVHDEPDPRWLLRPEVRRGLATVRDAGLAYDLLVRPRELPAALETARDLVDLHFVIDHIAKPLIASGAMDDWARDLAPFAEYENVWCKLSGMVTEADWHRWRPGDLQPYVDRVMRWFGPQRLLFGSDWPVCLLAATYDRVKAALAEVLGPVTEEQRRRIFGENAVAAYRLRV